MKRMPEHASWSPRWPKMTRHERKAFHRENKLRRLRGEAPLPKPMIYYGGL